MKGFIWNIESAEQFKEVLRNEFSNALCLNRDYNNLYNTEIKYTSEYEKECMIRAYKYNKTDIPKDSVSYYINEYGARGKWEILSSPDDYLTIAVFGCSFTFCTGIPEDKTWHSQIKKKLKSHKPVRIINLGYPGGNISKSLKFFKYLTDIYKIDIAVFLLPTHWRYEHTTYHTPDERVYFQDYIPNFPMEDKKWKEYYTYATEGSRCYDALKTLSYIELIASTNNIETYYSSWDETTLNLVRDNKIVPTFKILPVFKFLENITPHLKTKFASDGEHPGMASQDLFSSEVVDHIQCNSSNPKVKHILPQKII